MSFRLTSDHSYWISCSEGKLYITAGHMDTFLIGMNTERLVSMVESFDAVINQKKGISLSTALKIEREFGYDEGFLLVMQVYYDIEKDKQKTLSKTLDGFPNVRRILFWDTDFDSIDWAASKESVITRILERGNDAEKVEIARYYGISVDSLKDFAFTSSYKYKGKQS